ncbi:MotA/TolQ/ExbB proton channel family protein [Trinickia soli]|uniref:MotA/TolQ/ExbB proton channel family protein n=1 Tax=Trinickia soli TaxID=380675 RepID=UPI001256E7CB|nr:MotA/TolQ/ExbB proton channel family protein [Paraburkholderia sp. T12-10]
MSESVSSLIAHAALWILLAFSVASWALIMLKALQAVRAGRADRRFERSFGQATDLEAAARTAGAAAPDSPKAQLAAAFFGALAGAADAAPGIHAVYGGHAVHAGQEREYHAIGKELCERALAQRIRRERRTSENGLAVLASIGSTAPFVGLFGTVFGIIHALSAISHRASASIDVVAGPIGEALVATGVGIAVAVPAVLAYNFFVRRSKSLHADLDDFANDLLALAQQRGFALRSEHRHGATPATATTVRRGSTREALA